MQTQIISSKRVLQKELTKFLSTLSITGFSSGSTWADQNFALLRENGQILIDDGTIGWGAFMGSINQFIGSFNGEKIYCNGGAGIITGDGRGTFTAGHQYDLVLIEAPFEPSTVAQAVWSVKATLGTRTIVSGDTMVYVASQLSMDNAIELETGKAYMVTFKNNSGSAGINGFGINTTIQLGKGVYTG